jgi:hypothetical protein
MDWPVILRGLNNLRNEVRGEMTRVILVLIQHPRESGGGQVTMDRDSRKAHPRSVNNRRKYLLEGTELLRKCGLELERDLELGNSRTHLLTVLSGVDEKKSGKVPRVQIRTKPMTAHDTPGDIFDSKNVLGGHAGGLDPVRDRTLRPQTEFPSQGELAANEFSRAFDLTSALFGKVRHGGQHNADFVMQSNANSASSVCNTRSVKKDTAKSFWERLTEAFGEQALPTTGNAIAKKLGMSQGSVNKWQRGEGLPEADTIRELALRGRVCVEWLWTGRGPKYPNSEPDAQAAELMRRWPELDAKGREYVMQSAEMASGSNKTPEPTKPPAPVK